MSCQLFVQYSHLIAFLQLPSTIRERERPSLQKRSPIVLMIYWVERLNSWRRKLSALPMAGPCPEDMVGHGRTWLDMVGHYSTCRTWQTTKVNEKKVNEACSPFDKHLNWVIKGILHTSANSRVYLWKIWKLHRGTSRAMYFSDLFICNLIFSAIIRCEKQRKHSGQHCRWSINLLSRDFVDSTREVGAIATSQAVKKRSLCPADKSQFSLYPFASLQKLGTYIPNFVCNLLK